jgi:ERCC4-type nuclease
MKICIDNREHALINLVKALCKDNDFKNIEIEVKTLDLGDISIQKDDEELLLLERKNLNDLASSITDGRYREQSYRLDGCSLHNHNIIYIIEGDLSRYSSRYSKISKETLMVTMFGLNYFKGFSVTKTNNLMETAEYIVRLTDKLNRNNEIYGFFHDKFIKNEKTYTNVVHKIKKKNITPNNIGEIILSQIPGVSATTSKAIMKEFDSLHSLLNLLDKDKNCLKNITYTTKTGKVRHISNTSISNIIQFLLNQKSNILKIKT